MSTRHPRTFLHMSETLSLFFALNLCEFLTLSIDAVTEIKKIKKEIDSAPKAFSRTARSALGKKREAMDLKPLKGLGAISCSASCCPSHPCHV